MTLILKTIEAAVSHVKEGVIENNAQNGGRFADWHNADLAIGTYVDRQTTFLDRSLDYAQVAGIVGEWLSEEKTFEAAMGNAVCFLRWANDRDISRAEVSKMIAEGFHTEAPDWSDDLGPDYVTTLASGEIVAWGAEDYEGREMIVLGGNADDVLGMVHVPKWIEADAA